MNSILENSNVWRATIPAETPYPAESSDTQHKSQALPASHGLKLGAANVQEEPVPTFFFFLTRIASFCLMMVGVVAVTSSMILMGKTMGCDSDEIKNFASNKIACDGDSFHYYLAIVRLPLSFVMTILMFYVVSNAGRTAIGFGEPNEATKWASLSHSLSMAGTLGKNFVVLFVLSTFNAVGMFIGDYEVIDAPISLPGFAGSATLFYAFFFTYFFIYNICSLFTKLAEFGGDDEKAVFFMFLKNDTVQSKETKKLNIIYNLFHLFVFSFAIITTFIGLGAVLGRPFDYPKFARLVLVVLSLSKNLLDVITFFTKKRISKPQSVMFMAIALFFDSHAVVETILYAVTDSMKPVLITLIFFAWAFLATSVGYAFILQTRTKNEIMNFLGSVRDAFKDPDKGAKWCIRILTTFSSFVLVIAVIGKAYDFFPVESNEAGVYVYKWCGGISEPLRNDLTAFGPSNSLAQFTERIWTSMNIEELAIIAGTAMVVLLGYRYLGRIQNFGAAVCCVLLYQSLCHFREDSLLDGLMAAKNLGYVVLAPKADSNAFNLESRMTAFVLMWTVMTVMIDDDSRANKKLAETPMGKGRKKPELPQYLASHVFTMAMALLVCAVAVYTLTQPWFKISPKNMGFVDSNTAWVPGVNDPIEIVDKKLCPAVRTDAGFNAFSTSLNGLLANLNDRQNANSAMVEKLTQRPLDSFLRQAPFVAAIVLSMLYVFASPLVMLCLRRCAKGESFEKYEGVLTFGILYVLLMNFMYFAAAYFLLYVTALQIPYYFVDVTVGPGVYWMFANSLFAALVVLFRFSDIEAPMDEVV